MNARRSWYILALVALLALGLLAGCTRARNDAQIAGEVQSKINTDANVPTKQITVSSNNGVVTLTGNVGSEMERIVAANDAAQVEGVKTVINNLQVAPATTAALPEAAPEPAVREPARPRRTSPKVYSDRRSTSQETSSASAPSSAAMTSSAPVNTATVAPAPPPHPKPITIPDGTVIQVRMIDAVDSDRSQPGDRFRATLDTPVTIDDKVVVPQGADIEGRVAELKTAGHFTGRSEIALELTSVSYNGRRYALHTNQYSREGSSRGKNTAAKVGTGAAIGAVIGAIAGGGKGAAIGATVGAGAGGGVQAATKGQQIHVPSEALLSFRLESPLTVTPASAVNRSTTRSSDYNDTSDADPNAPVLKRRDQ